MTNNDSNTTQENPQGNKPVTREQQTAVIQKLAQGKDIQVTSFLFTGSFVHTMNGEVSRLSDGHTYIMPREEAMQVIASIMKVYNRLSDEDIRILNTPVETNRISASNNRSRKTGEGYVYLLRSASGMYKIGRAKDPEKRMKIFGVKLPFEVEFEALIQTIDMVELEAALHEQFADKQINGEWYALTPDDVEYIKSLAGGE